MNRIIACVVAIFFSVSAIAAPGETTYNTLSRLYVTNTGIKVYTTGSWNSPEVCENTSGNTIIVLQASHTAYQSVYSALLAAKSSGQQIAAIVSGCFSWGGQTFPQIAGVYLK